MSSYLAPRIVWDPPSFLYTILRQPIKTIVRFLDHAFNILRPGPPAGSPAIRVVCISDTHCLKTSVPDGDLLIHAGDLANLGSVEELQAQIDWLDSLPHEHKIAIAGNHDRHLDPRSREHLPLEDRYDVLLWKRLTYLQHSATNLRFKNGRQLSIYGAPQTPTTKKDDHAFRYQQGVDAWSETIPRDVDILVTHSPPKYHLDLPTASLGCEHLLDEVWRVQPRLHVYGHVHAGKSDLLGRLKGGREVARWDDSQRTLESALHRSDGFLRSILDPRSWIGLATLIFYHTSSLLWERVWGGSSPRPTTMVLASLMYCNSGELRNPPQVVYV